MSCHLKDFTWATKILSKYLPYVEKEYQKSVHHFNLGAIQFYQSRYDAAILHCAHVEKSNLLYHIDSNVLILKSYYELDKHYSDRTYQIFQNAERTISNNKFMSTAHKKSYKHFIQILMKLYRIRHNIGKQTMENIYSKMEKMKIITAKKWLLKKMKALDVNKAIPNLHTDPTLKL